MATLVSTGFTNVQGFRKAYQDTRAEALKKLNMVGKRVRFSSNCFLLQTYMNGQWVNHVNGLSAAEDKVRMYTLKAEDTEFRLVMNFDT